MKKIALLWAGIFLFSMQAKALNEPTLVCMEVRNNGELQITWIKPTDTLNFSHYVIYYSVSESGPFLTQQITATDVASCVIIGTDAITNPVYYCYMSAVSLSGQEYFSQTLHTMDFTVTPNYENGTALLRWDAPMNPLPSSFATTYTVFKKEPGDLDFSMLATTPNTVTQYIDMVDVCHDTVSYFVQILNRLTDYNCYYKSRVQKDSVVDKTPPNIPVLTLVTVNYDTQQIQLDWEVSGDANAYIIYWEDDTGLWVDVDTVVGETSWIDPVHDPRLKVQRYRIAAIDPCFNSTSITDPQRTMMLVVDYQDACRREAKLSWTAYQNMQGGIEKYEIYVSVNGAALQYLSEVSANNTSYIATDLETNQTYCFVVAAVNNGAMAKAYSTKTCFEFVEDETADFAYIRYVSVENNHHIAIKVFTSGDTLPFKKIELYRSVNTMNHFTLFSAQTYNGTAHYTFIDSTADVQTTLYYYKSLIINSCDAVATESNTAHNILLQGEATAQQNTCRWNEYATWDGGVAHYAVYRKMETDLDFAQIENSIFPTNYNTYTDDVAALYGFGSVFQYYVEATENVNQYGFNDRSKSNYIALTQLPNTYIPNAFSPLAMENKVFMPINSFVSPAEYRFQIFDRYGNLLFFTKDPYKGWDGRVKDDLMPIGVYVYTLSYKYPDGKIYQTKGTVTLVK